MRYPSTSPGRISDPGGSDDDDDTGGGTTGGGSIPGAPSDPDPDPDPAPPVDDIQQPAPAPPEPAPDPDPDPSSGSGGGSSSGGSSPDPADEFGQELGGDPAESGGSNSGAAPAPDPAPSPPSAGGSTDPDPAPDPPTNSGGPGASGDINFRFADQSDAIDPDPQFRNDSGARDFAERLTNRGRDVGDTIGGGVADAIGANADQREVLQSFAGAGTTLPGSAATIGVDAADALGFATEPARDAVEPGAQLGFGDLADIGGETATRSGELGAAAGDAAIEGADTIFDIDFERRAEGEGAAISFTDDPQVRNQLAGELAFGAFSLGAAGPASSATRGAAAAASRGARSVADAGSSGTARAADALDVDDFVADTRAQQQLGGQRSSADRDSGSPTIGGDDILGRPSEPDQGPAAFPDPQGRFEGGAGFSRGSPDRGDVDGPADVDPSGGGDGFGFRSPEREVETAQTPPRAGSPTDTDLRDTFDAPPPASSSSSGSGAAGGLGTLGAANDPTGIGDFGATGAGADLDPDRILGAGTSSTGAVSTTNDPTGITSDVTDQLDDGRIGGGTLPGDATGTGTGTDTDAGTDLIGATDTPTDTGTDTGTDTFLDTGTTTDLDTTTPPTTSTPTRSESRTGIRSLGATSTPDNGRPRFEDFEQDQPDDDFGFGAFASTSDEFGSGILSGDEAAEQYFGR